MFGWFHKIFRKDKSDGIRKDIALTVKLLHGDNWQSKLKLHKIKAIPFDKQYLRRYDKLMQEYIRQTFAILSEKLITDINVLTTIRTDDAELEPNIDIGNGFLTQIDAFESHAEEVLITFSVVIKEIGKDMLDKNNEVFAEQLREAFGFTPDFENDAIYSHLNSWVDENVNLIKNVDNISKTQLKTIVSQNFRNGGRAENMIKDIKQITSFKDYRLRLIARDQTAKLHGQITKRQQISIGIARYIWRGVADERERPSHVSLNNTQRKWSDGLEPGQEFQCRCTAEPVINFDDILRSFQ